MQDINHASYVISSLLPKLSPELFPELRPELSPELLPEGDEVRVKGGGGVGEKQNCGGGGLYVCNQ